jgi:hypothetical protein
MPVMRASKISSDGDEASCVESAEANFEVFWSRKPLAVASTIFTMEVHGIANGNHRLAYSKQPFGPPEISQRAEIRQRECEAILILIPHLAQGEATEFQTDSAAIPVVRGLYRRVLHES